MGRRKIEIQPLNVRARRTIYRNTSRMLLERAQSLGDVSEGTSVPPWMARPCKADVISTRCVAKERFVQEGV
jgi:hypothetical protein